MTPPRSPRIRRARGFGCRRGFSLVELIVVIVVLGILSSTVAVFIANPVRAYFETIRRAQLTDAADMVARRITRELQLALPNSVRVGASAGGDTIFIEFVPIDDTGRYRGAPSAGAEPGGIDPLAIDDVTDTQFQVLGRPVTVTAGAQLVIFNLGSGPFDAYAGGNRRVVSTPAGAAQTLAFVPTGSTFPADSPDRRFYLVSGAVTYACTPAADGSGRLERFAGYALQAAQPVSTAAAPLSGAGATRSLIVDKVSGCSFEPGNTPASINTVNLILRLSDGGETVTLQTQTQLQNSP